MIKLNNLIKVSCEQFHNKNQFIVRYYERKPAPRVSTDFVAFQSYKTLIAIFCPNTHIIYVNWSKCDYSKTTMKHLKMFINEETCYQYDNKMQFLHFLKTNKEVILFEE